MNYAGDRLLFGIKRGYTLDESRLPADCITWKMRQRAGELADIFIQTPAGIAQHVVGIDKKNLLYPSHIRAANHRTNQHGAV